MREKLVTSAAMINKKVAEKRREKSYTSMSVVKSNEKGKMASSSKDSLVSSDDEDFSFSDSSNESDLEDLQEMFEGMQLQPFQFEPLAKKKTEPKQIQQHNTTLGNDKEKSRIGSLLWCKCELCRRETREIDCLCCQEVDALSDEKFSGKTCITESNDFEMLCLRNVILLNVLVGLHETRGNHLESNPTNRSLRFAAYKQFTWFAYTKLGKGNRRVIPSCVLWKIRDTFPEENGEYVPFEHCKD